MNDRIRAMAFRNFRGLPDNNFDIKGRNLLLLGANGKGKSGLVDGVEFLFSGHVSRFLGRGSGGIDHDQAIQHIQRRGDPEVSASLIPSNSTVTRFAGGNPAITADRERGEFYMEEHPRVESFILRRDRILEFIFDREADRYQKFVQLLGISDIDHMQRRFNEALQTATNNLQRSQAGKTELLAQFRDPDSGIAPQRLSDIFSEIQVKLREFEILEIGEWAELDDRLAILKGLRTDSNKEMIDALARAQICLDFPLPQPIKEIVENSNIERARVGELRSASADGPKSSLIDAAVSYLSTHQDDSECPVCERSFDTGISDVLERLKSRRNSLRELREAELRLREQNEQILRFANQLVTQLRADLRHSDVMDAGDRKAIRRVCAVALWWMRSLKGIQTWSEERCAYFPKDLEEIAALRRASAERIESYKNRLIPKDSSRLEAAIAYLERAAKQRMAIGTAEITTEAARQVRGHAAAARSAFAGARESAIQMVFDRIGDTVIEFYRYLHDLGTEREASECTAIALKPSARAAAGGLRLTIEFLGAVPSVNPRTFLSEGHLDSLGLCIFLATVKIFNPPGSLLVLDDVLTSIDKEHRRRVGELLLRSFEAYQLFVTTHDEYWYELLKSMVRAWGRERDWKFIEVEGWDVDLGPVLSSIEGTWGFVDAHLTESDFRELGGPFRFLLEDFSSRVAAKLGVKVAFRIDARYTAGDFVAAGIQDTLRSALKKCTPEESGDIDVDIGRVFGQGNLVNFLSHKNPGRLEITFDQARDFIAGLKSLISRCEQNKLIAGG